MVRLTRHSPSPNQMHHTETALNQNRALTTRIPLQITRRVARDSPRVDRTRTTSRRGAGVHPNGGQASGRCSCSGLPGTETPHHWRNLSSLCLPLSLQCQALLRSSTACSSCPDREAMRAARPGMSSRCWASRMSNTVYLAGTVKTQQVWRQFLLLPLVPFRTTIMLPCQMSHHRPSRQPT